MAFPPPRCDAEMRTGVDDRLFHVVEEPLHAAGAFLHAPDGIGHQLAGKVAGDVAAARGLDHLDALAVQEGLNLPNTAIESDGLGAVRPVASNDTEEGRAQNRRVVFTRIDEYK